MATARTHKDARRSYLARKYGAKGDLHHARSWLDTDVTTIPSARAQEGTPALIVDSAQENRRVNESESATIIAEPAQEVRRARQHERVFGRFTAVRTYRGRRNSKAASRGRYRVRALIHAWA